MSDTNVDLSELDAFDSLNADAPTRLETGEGDVPDPAPIPDGVPHGPDPYTHDGSARPDRSKRHASSSDERATRFQGRRPRRRHQRAGERPEPREDEFRGPRSQRSARDREPGHWTDAAAEFRTNGRAGRNGDRSAHTSNGAPIEAPIDPPHTWPDDAKAAFKRLPPAAQHFMAKRHKDMEADYTRKTQELSDRGRLYEELDDIVKPRLESIQMAGMTVPQYFAQIAAASDFAGRDLPGFIKWIAAQRQIPIETLAQMITDPAQGPALDPELMKRDQAIAELRQQQQSLQQYIQSQQQAAEQQQMAALQQTLDKFLNATDRDGNLKHPYAEQVADQMSKLLEAGMADSLEDAYDKAVHLDPSLRPQRNAAAPEPMPPIETPVLQAPQEPWRENEASRRQRAARAARAGSSVAGAPRATRREPRTESVYDTVSDVWDEHFN